MIIDIKCLCKISKRYTCKFIFAYVVIKCLLIFFFFLEVFKEQTELI